MLYLGGVVGPWGYLAAAAAALAALFVPDGRRMEGLEALEYLYRWRRVCMAAVPLRALAAAAMAALAPSPWLCFSTRRICSKWRSR